MRSRKNERERAVRRRTDLKGLDPAKLSNIERRKKQKAYVKGSCEVLEDGYWNFGSMSHSCEYCGALHWLGERAVTAGSTMKSPKFHKCCGNVEFVSHNLLPVVCNNCNNVFVNDEGALRAHDGNEMCPKCKKIVPEPLAIFANSPPLLRFLLSSQDIRAERFRKHIRHYNNAFAMGSFQSNFVS